eukprot:GHVQ01004763.1.p1 GENE.GHVQ01004763.1~~GHVQ01004763.1.p1  ORF type:complete len:344 (+),score=24.56 GHVQ01004763.1:111-1034(+)
MADLTFPTRNFVGYGSKSQHPKWPGGARIAVSFVINYEEGAESCVLNGDQSSEGLLGEIAGTLPLEGHRNLNMESMYEYGSRAGFWRLHRNFVKRKLPVTVFACGKALEDNPDAGMAMIEAGFEVATHGYRWLDYRTIDETTEREHIRKTVETHTNMLGVRPVGFYQGKTSMNTRRLVVEEGGFQYDNDSYADDIPYWNRDYGAPLLIIPYSLDTNDMKFACTQGFNSSDQFYSYLRDAFDVLYEEGQESPKMMSIGLHCRLSGRPGKTAGLLKFLDYIATKPDVWVCRRREIAEHWHKVHPAQVEG